MRDYVKKQLEQCALADLSNFDPATNTYHIPKYTKPTFDLNKMYLIRVFKTQLIKENNVIAINWNHNSIPPTEYLKIYVSKTLGHMIYVDAIGYNYETKTDTMSCWSGWLDMTQIEQIAKL